MPRPGGLGSRLRILSTLLVVAAGCGGGGGGTGAAGAGGGLVGSAGTTGVAGGGGGQSGATGIAGAGGDAGASGVAGSGGAAGVAGAGGATSGVAGSGAGGGGGVAGASGTAGAGGSAGGSAGRGGAGGIAGGVAGGGGAAGMGGRAGMPLEQLQRAYVDLRFGMFIHFGILTYTGAWAEPGLPINMFNPTGLNAGQWADAAVAAKMTYGVLTTRHHDGFALWPSTVGNFSVRNIPWMNGQGDVVRAYVDAFRAKGLQPGLYYSIWDSTQGTGNGSGGTTGGAITITSAHMAYVRQQLTELLTNYGPIPILIIDGWSWRMGHKAAAYEEIRALVKSLQPNCLLTDHTHLQDPWEVDIVNFEEPRGAFVPSGNTYAGNQEQKINATGGNDWFWSPNIGGLMTVTNIVTDHLRVLEPRWTNFLLNCPPNRQGLMDAAIVTRLTEVGQAWSPNTSRPPLPSQGTQIEFPYTPVSATSTSGNAANAARAIDGINDYNRYTIWRSSGALPQSVTLDLGSTKPDVGLLGYVPEYVTNAAVTAGAITSYAVLVSTDGTTFTEATSGTWAADRKMKVATFGPVAARYVRLEARAASGGSVAVATEVSVGARR